MSFERLYGRSPVAMRSNDDDDDVQVDVHSAKKEEEDTATWRVQGNMKLLI